MGAIPIPAFMKQTGHTRGQVNRMLDTGLEHVKIGTRILILDGAHDRWLKENTVRRCPQETVDTAYIGLRNAVAGTLSGQSADAVASEARALRIAKRLK